MSNHHPLSPSKADMWVNCVGAPKMWEHSPALFSNSANEGTAAHNMLEQCLKVGVAPEFFRGGVFEVDGEDIEVDDDMIEALNLCLCIVKNHVTSWFGVEVYVPIPQVASGYYGYSDFIGYNAKTGKLIILDFKYGRTPVPAEDNFQLLLYAIGATHLETIGEVNEIELVIVQPRDAFKKVKSVFITPAELTKWLNKFKAAYNATKQAIAPRSVGSHCKFCPGKIQCPEYLSAMDNIPEPPFELTPERIEYLLDILSTAKRAYEDVKTIALNFQQQGKHIPNRKIVRKVTHRKIASEEKLLAELKKDPDLKASDYSVTKLKGVTDLVKLNKAYIESNLVKPEGSLELVPLSDSRPAISTAAHHFTMMIGEKP